MDNKLYKYLIYISKFINSPNKKQIIRELKDEVKGKGFVEGVRSLLHRKIHLKGVFFDEGAASDKKLLIHSFDTTKRFVLPNPKRPIVSIIIPMYNQLEYTCNCVDSIYTNNEFKDYEVIIADDNSTDSTELLSTYFQNIRIIRNAVNLGFLKNCNNAAAQAKGEYVVFLNNDTQVQKDWLASLLSVFENFEKVGLVGSKLIYPDGKLQEAGGIIWPDASGWNYGNRDNPNKHEYNYVKEADYISGASIMLPKKLWDQLGGFDELFTPAYCEDSDICFRIRQAGYKVMYQPFSEVVHFEGISHGTDVNSGIKHYQVLNNKKFYERWKVELSKKSKSGENVFFERDRTQNKKHVLVIDHYLPTIDKDAGSRTISNFIDSLLALDYSVKFLGENQNIGIHYQIHFQKKGVEVLYGSPYNFYDQSWKGYLKENHKNFDAMLLSRSSVCAPILAYLRTLNYKGNVIYYGHDLGYLRLEQEAAAKNDPELKRQAAVVKAQEDYMYMNADNSLIINDEEARYLKQYIEVPLHYVPPYFFDIKKEVKPFELREGLLFVGGFNHPPNREAVSWFLEQIYSDLYKQGIPLVIAGSKVPAAFYEYEKKFPGLRICADVSDEELNRLYENTRIAIVPLLFGAGVKGKVIESMAKGVPIVGTDIAFEGMPKDGNYKYKGVNTAGDFCGAILSLYNNNKLWSELSEFGQKYVEENFNRDNMKSVFKKLIG